jgi:hypothetical protein
MTANHSVQLRDYLSLILYLQQSMIQTIISHTSILDYLYTKSQQLYDYFAEESFILDVCNDSTDYTDLSYNITGQLPVRLQLHDDQLILHVGSDHDTDYLLSSRSFWSYSVINNKFTKMDIYKTLIKLYIEAIETQYTFT